MSGWNEQLFLFLNASEPPDALAVPVAEFLARWLVVVASAVAAGLWVWGRPSKRGALLSIGVAVAAALGLNQLLGLLWFEPRPFMIGLGHTLMAHAPENSFPSDHATFMWALGLGLVATGRSRAMGLFVCALGLLVAWARIYLGLHFPIDMAGSLLVATFGAALACALESPIERLVLPIIDRIYETALVRLGLPPVIFPRQPGSIGR